MKANSLIAFFVTLSLNQVAYAASPEENKKIVTQFYEMAFNAHQPEAAMKTFVGETYIQHNPHVANGQKPFIDFFVPYFKKNPHARSQIKRVIAEGDLVAVHVHSQQKPGDPGRAVVDIFRLENVKIVEHWDGAAAINSKAV